MDEYIQLSNGVEIPPIGFGTWQLTKREVLRKSVIDAIEAGYSLFDLASAYLNETSMGRVIKEIGNRRKELFLSDKVWNTNRGYSQVQNACKASLKKLKTDYLDLYLIHWPATSKQYGNWAELNAQTWRGMERLYYDGLVRAIGVCNFKPNHLKELMKTADLLPMVNQIEFHPGMCQDEVIEYASSNGIALEASSPLGSGQILGPCADSLAGMRLKYSKTTAQICIRYCIDNGFIPIIKSGNTARIKENIDVFDFKLTKDEIEKIREIPYCGGLGIEPDEEEKFG